MKFLYTLLLGMTVIIGLLSYNIISQKKKFNIVREKERTQLENVEKAWEQSLLYSGRLHFRPGTILFDTNNNKIDVKDLLTHRSDMLILRISQSYCITCLDIELPKLQKFAASAGNEKIAVITNTENYTEISQLMKLKGIYLPVYNMDGRSGIFDNIDEHTAFFFPLLFRTDSTGIARSFFIMNSSDHDVSDGYYKSLINEFVPKKN